jgi:hypothetical protein
MIKIYIVLLILVIAVLPFKSLVAQQDLNQPNLRWYLSDDKSSYAGIVTVNQIWTRYIMNNPDRLGVAQYPDYDIGIRRSRLIFYTYLMDKVFMYTQVGYDGNNYLSKTRASRCSMPRLNIYFQKTSSI